MPTTRSTLSEIVHMQRVEGLIQRFVMANNRHTLTSRAKRDVRSRISFASPNEPTAPANGMLFLLWLVVALAAWSPTSFAQRQAIITGISPLNVNGSANGVDMTGATTLDVGPGSPTDIFTTHTSLTSPTPAVTTGASSTGNVVFLGNSNVYGAIGMPDPVGPYLLNVTGGANGATVNFLGLLHDTTALVQIDCMDKRIPDAAWSLQAPGTAFQAADAARP
jgi:hypothetical protein